MPLSPTWNPHFISEELNLSTPFSHFDPPLSGQGAALSHLDNVPPHNLVIWTDGSVPFGEGSSGVIANYDCCSLCGPKTILSFAACPVCSDFLLKPASFCKLSAGLGNTNKSATTLLCSSSPTLALPPTLWSILCVFFTSISPEHLAGTFFALLLYLSAYHDSPDTHFSGERHG